ncbi:hypothetical protein [Epilithonimonas sp.]|uniref:ORC-CDC6 family AAA ATPase n=1 Tax=Epilithonimonas sp. TaxID=2894511 RepID=UPI0028AFB10E|nr:hypothetical protein [Epilithonimonas sp.]
MENPFVFDRPNNISVDDFLKFYIQDNTYTRFLESTRNIILIGVRGSGKTSTLLYYSYPIQLKNDSVENKQEIIGIHIPCKHPLLGKREYLLYKDDTKKYIVVEHFLTINILSCICETLLSTYDSLEIEEEIGKNITEYISFILDADLSIGKTVFEKVKLFLGKESIVSQRKLNNDDFESFIDYSFSFNNTIIPFLEQLKSIPKLKDSHFSLFFDDVQDLSQIHKEIINSWVSYRDNKLFSFKIATADIKPFHLTSNGGVILEGHDFIKIDLTKKLFSKDSEFSNFARDVIDKRLIIAGINKSVYDFFPINESFKENLELGKEKAREIAQKKFPEPKGTQINDFVAKNGRAYAFRRIPKANLPNYSGFDTIVDISTGVIRNLLTPIFYMYEKELSNTGKDKVEFIPDSTQSDIIKQSSNEFWNKLRNIDSEIEDCSSDLSRYINNFFNELMIYLKKRLAEESIAEPRALNFIISQKNKVYDDKVNEIIDICLRSTLLYKRTVSHKGDGTKLDLFVPNRLLLPAHGLDPHGQYSHFPIPAKAFIEAAYNKKNLPFFKDDDDTNIEQLEFNFE